MGLYVMITNTGCVHSLLNVALIMILLYLLILNQSCPVATMYVVRSSHYLQGRVLIIWFIFLFWVAILSLILSICCHLLSALNVLPISTLIFTMIILTWFYFLTYEFVSFCDVKHSLSSIFLLSWFNSFNCTSIPFTDVAVRVTSFANLLTNKHV